MDAPAAEVTLSGDDVRRMTLRAQGFLGATSWHRSPAGVTAMLRRVGAESVAERVVGLAGRRLPRGIIPWHLVEPLETKDDAPAKTAAVRLTIPHAKLALLHPADIADIVEEMTADERIVVAYPGIDPVFSPEGEAADLGGPYVLGVGTLAAVAGRDPATPCAGRRLPAGRGGADRSGGAHGVVFLVEFLQFSALFVAPMLVLASIFVGPGPLAAAVR